MKTVGIIAAIDTELQILREALSDPEIQTVAGQEFYVGTLGDVRLVLLLSGVGKVSAGAGAMTMILAFSPDCIINTGAAGALAPDLGIGDLVLATSAAEWDLDTTVLGDPRGYISSLGIVELKPDEELRKVVATCISEEQKVFEGLIVSGDQFVSTTAQRDTILGSFPEALCTEMEGAAIGHVCAQAKVPFCIIRGISDTADGSSEVDYPTFCLSAGRRSAAILMELCLSGKIA